MIDLHLNHGSSHEGVYLRLPATPGEVGEAFAMLENLGKGKVTIFDVSCPIQNIRQYIMHTDINDKDNFAKLQKLAASIDAMHKTERQIFSGALDAESINGLDDVLRVADHLEDYVLFPNISNDTELGRFLVDSGCKDFPEAVRPYLDYRAIGIEYYAENGGAYGPDGYVRRKNDQERIHDRRNALITLHLTSRKIEIPCRLVLPAMEEELEQTKERLGIEHFTEATIVQVEFGKPYMDEMIPKDSICVEDANELALGIEEMWQRDGELLKFLSVLSVEQPETLTDALHFAIELDDYERITEDTHEYGQSVLRRHGADDELLEVMYGYMDFEKLGEDSMIKDGVRQTEFGMIRRCSTPFPEPEQSQQMF